MRSVDYDVSVDLNAEDRITFDGKLDLVKAAIGRLGAPESTGYDLFLHTGAPPGSGLGSSSAVMVTLVGLLKEFRNTALTDYDIAALAYEIERFDLGIEGGLQDQYAAAFGGFNYMEFLPERVIVNPLKVPQDVINELEYNLLLCYTGTVRLSAHIIEDQVRRYEVRDETTLSALRELKRLASAMKDALLSRDLDEFGRLLHEDWEQKKRVSDRITNAHVDALYQAARSAGALGGKITGAGGGGYLLLYCEYERKHEVATELTQRGCAVQDVRFEPAGLQTWRVVDPRPRR